MIVSFEFLIFSKENVGNHGLDYLIHPLQEHTERTLRSILPENNFPKPRFYFPILGQGDGE